MTPEEYIEKLKEAQRTLDSAKEDLDRAIQRMEKRLETGYEYLEQESRLDLDRAIQRMEKRLETGYEYLEQESRLAALAGREYIKLADSRIFKAATTKIEY